MNLHEIETEILRADPGLKREDEAFKAKVVMLTSAFEGTMSVKRLAKMTGLPYSLVAKFAHNLRKNGVWKGRKIYANWSDKENGGIEFELDTCIALGWMNRAAA